MDDDGIPESAEARLRVAGKIIERAAQLGIPQEDVVVDPLALTMGADSSAGRIALDTIELLVAEFGVNVTMGASNISFGMPDRKYINSTFIAMAIHAGPHLPHHQSAGGSGAHRRPRRRPGMGRDDYGMTWIKAYRAAGRPVGAGFKARNRVQGEDSYDKG
jgi:5-methyltetrahydrofolate--homocysteine methyltransferase